MVVMHIAHIDENLYAGVNAAIPQHIRAQQQWEDVCFVNLTNRRISGIRRQFAYGKGFCLDSLDAPYRRPELVVFHEVYRPAYLGLSGELRRRGIPYIIVPHGSLTEAAQHKKRLKKMAANLLLFDRFVRGAAAIQCLSDNELLHTGRGNMKFVGSNGVDTAQVKTSFSDDGLRLAYIGRLEPHIKGLDLLIVAVERERGLLERHRCKLTVCGPEERGERTRLQEQVKRRSLSELISIRREVWGEEKRAVLQAADCFVQTSRSEGMSMGLLEALSYGLPCIVTQGTGLAELVAGYGAGWGCETTVSGIAGALRAAVLDRESFPERSLGAAALVEEKFLWERIVPGTLDQYRRIAGSKIKK